MNMPSKEGVKKLFLRCLKKVRYLLTNGSFNPSILEELHRSTLVNCIKHKSKSMNLDVILSEVEFVEFRSVNELVN